jgi:hypothetical protein
LAKATAAEGVKKLEALHGYKGGPAYRCNFFNSCNYFNFALSALGIF